MYSSLHAEYLYCSNSLRYASWNYRLEREKSQGIDPLKSVSTLKTAEDVKAHLENQLRQARQAAQQVVTWATVPHWGFYLAASYRGVNQASTCIKHSSICILETAGAAETKWSSYPSHDNSNNHCHLSWCSCHPSVHRLENGSGYNWNENGPGFQTGLSSVFSTRQKFSAVICFLGEAGSDQQFWQTR